MGSKDMAKVIVVEPRRHGRSIAALSPFQDRGQLDDGEITRVMHGSRLQLTMNHVMASTEIAHAGDPELSTAFRQRLLSIKKA